MGKLRNFYNKAVKKYVDFKAKFNAFKIKFLREVYWIEHVIIVKLSRFKVDFDYYYAKLLKKLHEHRIKLADYIEIHRDKKIIRLQTKIGKAYQKHHLR